MIGGWMEAKAQLAIGVKLDTDFPSNACWEGWDAQQLLGDGKYTRFVIPIPGLNI